MNHTSISFEDEARESWKRMSFFRTESSKLEDGLGYLDNDLKDLEIQRRRLDAQIETLKQQKQAKEQTLRTAHHRTTSAMAEYDRGCTRQFCDKVHARLPRELRDMVYEYLVLPGLFDVLGHWRDPSRSITLPGPELWFERVDGEGVRQPEVARLSVDMIGVEMRTEIAETWYRASTFRFAVHLELVRKFLDTDHWNAELNPYSLVKKVLLSIDATAVRDEWSINDQLRKLCNLESGAHIGIIIYTGTISRGWSKHPTTPDEHLSEFLGILKTCSLTLQQLREHGVRFELLPVQKYRWDTDERSRREILEDTVIYRFTEEILDMSRDEVAELVSISDRLQNRP
ncbi:hypothetical protein BDV96DRAFT_644564 [Lophiotrema nucula]|uniref:Uncharacterized protein n=1 Tax=Lophiotrema nucula TaxID=690887 RepID=A0A6A5ZFC7_9PLEO|nr:hypothetical protein BDV96DRAFT_644564 [Lophiotrema nucula]